jgi:hypothetical protein
MRSIVNLSETPHSPHAQQADLRRQLFCMSEVSDEDPLQGLKESYLLLSRLPPRFIRDGVRAGTVFIDVFEEAHRSLTRSPLCPPAIFQSARRLHGDVLLVQTIDCV